MPPINEDIGSFNFIIDKNYAGIRIDYFLSIHLQPQKHIDHAFKTGNVFVNEKEVKKSYILMFGDNVTIVSPDFEIVLTPVEERKDKLPSIKIQLDKVKKKLKETNQRLAKNEDALRVEKNKNAQIEKEFDALNQEFANLSDKLEKCKENRSLLELENSGLIHKITSHDSLLNDERENNTFLNTRVTAQSQKILELSDLINKYKSDLQEKEREILRLGDEDYMLNQLQAKKTLVIGKFDTWTQDKFEKLQANTKQRIDEYKKMLANYQNELDLAQGRNPKKKTTDEDIDKDNIISNEDKTRSLKEYNEWSQLEIDKLKESTLKLFWDYDFLLKISYKELKRFQEKEEPSENTYRNNTDNRIGNKKESESIVNEIKKFLSNLKKEIKEIKWGKEPRTEKSKSINKYIKIIIRATAWLFIIIFIASIIIIFYQSFHE